MMKRLRLVFLLLSLTTLSAKAQILDAVGIAGGITYGEHDWNPEYFNTQEKFLLGFNVAGLVEFFHNPHFRWRVELEYNQMGSKELQFQLYTNRTNYITLNNYLKIQYRLVWIMPYMLIGPRVEYLLVNSPQVLGSMIGAFPKVSVTGAVGVGFEFINDGLFRPFVEAFYNHDILPSYHGTYQVTGPPLSDFSKGTIYYFGYELRVGVRYVFDNKTKKAKCPTVINPAGS
jgi:hypothetical protein